MTKTRQWSLVTAIVVIVVFAGGWFLLVKPQQSQISSVKAQAVTQQQANQVLLQQIASRQGQEKQLPHEQAQLQKLATQVPTAPDEPGIIRSLSSSASGAGVNLLSLTPGAATTIAASTTTPSGATTLSTTAAGELIELPVTMSVVGSYANLESYFQLLEKLPRALLVTEFSVCPEAGAASGSTSCTAPVPPDGTNVAANDLGATITANVFFSPTTPVAVTGTATTLPGATTPTTPAPTATTPATTPASPAATTPASPTAAAPAN